MFQTFNEDKKKEKHKVEHHGNRYISKEKSKKIKDVITSKKKDMFSQDAIFQASY
jgi:hypothetical protein